MFKYLLIFIVVLLLLSGVGYGALSLSFAPQKTIYGVSFNTMYARELGLDWKEVYGMILDDLEVRHLRLAAHWPMIEPEKDRYNFEELDYQMQMAEDRGAQVVLGVGRRLPRWPECHVPEWAKGLSWDEQKEELRAYITEVVERYKGYSNISYWQVENEPFLGVFAREHCGALDVAFLDEEIALVRELDPGHKILVTDSGNLGLWQGAYRRGDAFGTSVYVYFWNPEVGQFKSHLPPSFYRMKANLMALLFGRKETMLIELSAEPWLINTVTNTEIPVQLERMNPEKFEDILAFAKKTHLEKQYLWGAEWWYWLKQKGHPEMWDRAKRLYAE